MKKIILGSVMSMMLMLGSLSSVAGDVSQGGFKGPGLEPTSVKEALALKDDSRVTLRGNIERSLGGDQYLFKDSTGSIEIEIDGKRWNGLTVTPADTVEISGKVDKDWNSTEIDVKRIQKVSQ